MNLKKLFTFPISKNLKYWIIAPCAIVLIACIMFGIFSLYYKDAQKGMNIGIDFSGGSVMTVTLGDEIKDSAKYDEYADLIKDIIESDSVADKLITYGKSDEYKEATGDTIDLAKSVAKAKVTYEQSAGSGESYAIVFKYDNISSTYDKDNTLSVERNKIIKDAVSKALYTKLGNSYEIDEVEDMVIYDNIGATASAELLKTALMCVAISLAIILVYIIIRFEIWSGIAAVVALLHDVIILIALTIVFHVQVNSAFIAAVITIVSYSINNTIVVFDRLRENMKNEKKLNVKFDNALVLDQAVRQTALRSINSTITTMVPIVLFAILGSSTVNEFALPVIFGLIAGFYSSMFIAPSLYYTMIQARDKRKMNATPKKDKQVASDKPKYVGAKN